MIEVEYTGIHETSYSLLTKASQHLHIFSVQGSKKTTTTTKKKKTDKNTNMYNFI